ncbi:MAG: purine-cytosine permease family protein [Segniliparus sp.]|uniref:purine-cytosine permease family protein n=1 Tax=Segniliparus sp. TaxID=2804064 RepID=UPI003F3ED6F7
MSDSFGRVEARGVDHVPACERHGKPRELFWVWLASNVSHLYIVLGGAVLLLGLTLWQALAVVFVGNAFWVLVGWLSISGYASGTPSCVVTRALFGVRGNRVFGAGMGWLTCVLFESINLVLGASAGFALARRFGVSVGVPVEAAVLCCLAAATFALSVYGHATIVRLSVVFTVVLAIGVALLGYFVVGHARLDYAPPVPLSGAKLWTALLAGFALAVSTPFSWGSSADYARYLPERSSPRAVLLWTAAGGFLPSFLLCAIGALAGTRIDMSDPQVSLAQIVPGWFYPVFLVLIVVGTVTNNVLTAYSSGLALQAMGVRLSRAWSVLLDGLVAGAVAVYALFVASSFVAALGNALQVVTIVCGPTIAIYAMDIALRRNRYNGPELLDESERSPHWHQGGFRLAGVLALVCGTTAGLACVNTALYEGPVARALGGMDVSVVAGSSVGLVVFCAVRWLGARSGAALVADPA